MAPMFGGLPDGRCQCPHWGYVLKGSEMIQFSPTAEMKATDEAIRQYMEANAPS